MEESVTTTTLETQLVDVIQPAAVPAFRERLLALARAVLRWCADNMRALVELLSALDEKTVERLMALDPAVNPATAGLLALVAALPVGWFRILCAMVPIAFRLLRAVRNSAAPVLTGA